MGKVARGKKPKRPQQQPQQNPEEKTTAEEDLLPFLQEKTPNEPDTVSVVSYKSVKQKFGLKKRITKADKLKFKREILKKKINIQHELKGMKKKETSGASEKGGKLDFSNFDFYENDEDETKLPGKPHIKRPISKKNKRRKDFVKDVDYLKKLMNTKIKKSIQM